MPWKHVVLFCLLAYAFLWIPLAASGRGSPWILAIMGPYSPLPAAVVMRSVISREGFRGAGLRLRQVPFRYWLLAVGMPFFWNTVQDLLYLLIFGWRYLASRSVWTCVLMHSYNNLISLKLLSEGWSVTVEPSLLQAALMSLPPILMIWAVLWWKGSFAEPEKGVIS